jgi:hypothetical protein
VILLSDSGVLAFCIVGLVAWLTLIYFWMGG